MAEIQIEYCLPCGLLPDAEQVQHALLEEFGHGIDGLRMKPGHGGVFKVGVDGELIFDKKTDGFDPDDHEGHSEEPASRGEGRGLAARLSSRICPADDVTTSRRGVEDFRTVAAGSGEQSRSPDGGESRNR